MNLLNIDNYSKQEIFDFVVNKLLDQGHGSTDERGRCMYRADNGSRCAIGWLMPDTWVAKEDFCYTGTLKKYDVRVSVEQLFFLEDLQRAHDYAALRTSMRCRRGQFAEKLEERCQEVAKTYGLNMKVFEAGHAGAQAVEPA